MRNDGEAATKSAHAGLQRPVIPDAMQHPSLPSRLAAEATSQWRIAGPGPGEVGLSRPRSGVCAAPQARCTAHGMTAWGAMFLALALLLFGAAPSLAADPTFPALTGRVVDAANLLDAGQWAALDTSLAALEN